MLVVMLSLTGLASVGAVSLMMANGSLKGAAHQRFQDVAMMAAESGVAAGMAYLRTEYDSDTRWSELVEPNNEDPQVPAALPGNQVQPGAVGNLFSSGVTAWYEVTVLNNAGDPGLAAGNDQDARVVLRSTGHGPDGAMVIVEVEVGGSGLVTLSSQCGSYGQRGQSESGSGREDCLGTVNPNTGATYTPGG